MFHRTALALLLATGCLSTRSVPSVHEVTTPYRGRTVGGGELVIVLDEGAWTSSRASLIDAVNHTLLRELPRHLRNASTFDGARIGATDVERVERALPLRGGALTVPLPADGAIAEVDGLSAPYVAWLHRIDLDRDPEHREVRATVEWSIWDNRAGLLVGYGRAVTSADDADLRDAADTIVQDLARIMIAGSPFFPGSRM